MDNDFRRTERQRKVIGAIINKALKTNPFTLVNAVKEVLPYISTDINKSDFISLGIGAVLRYIHFDIDQKQIPADGTWYDKNVPGVGASLVMDMEENRELLHNFLAEPQSKSEETTTK